MKDPIENYWKIRLEACRAALEENGFEAFTAEDPAEAGEIIFREILPKTDAKIISYADSLTLRETGVLDRLRAQNYALVETFEENVPREEIIERRRRALLSDLFFTGTNAVTASGMLVNLDMIGNRTAAIAFGPKHVVLTIGRNKIVPDLSAAINRVKNLAAPMNAVRHPRFKTPCRKTGFCMDCKSPDRICNVWAITEKSFPKGRIRVVLINRDLGL